MTPYPRFYRFIIAFWVLSRGLCLAGAHPVSVDEKSQCLDCHEDHAAGNYVHAAVKMGCNSCHQVENRDGAIYVALKPTKSVVCLECHQQEEVSSPHFPYASGMCIRCHDPHTSANPRLLRAKVNELCLSCHAPHSGRAPSQYLPTIVLTSDNRLGHPYARHPVSGTRDPLTGDEMSCISCHLAHGSAKVHHLKMGSAIPEDALNQTTETNDMCHKCHMRLWGTDNISSKKKKRAKAD